MDEGVNSAAGATGQRRSVKEFLISPKAESLIPSLFYAVLVFTPLSRTAMTFLLPDRWQISGYYLDGLFYGLIFALGVAWLLSIIMLFGKREFSRGLKRTVAIPAILFLGGIVAVVSRLFLPSTISGWPIDTVHSVSRGKYFILAEEPAATDVIYRVFSAEGSRLNPIWRVELAGTVLDYSEDGSLTENPHLIFSKDEQILVVGRGGHLTDAVLIDPKQPLTQFVPWDDADRERQWQRRTNTIGRLLAVHAGPAAPNVAQFTEPEVRARLDAWCRRIEPELAKAISRGGWRVSCAADAIEPAKEGRHKVWFRVTCQNGETEHQIVREMSLVQDGSRLLIAEQDTDLSWSTEEEKALCERLRLALLGVAASGEYLDTP